MLYGRDEFLAVNDVSPENPRTYTHTYTHCDVGQFRLYVSVCTCSREISNVRTGDTVSIKCYLPVSQIYTYISARMGTWFAMYFGNVRDSYVRENTVAVRRGGNYCIVLTAGSKVRRETPLRKTAKFCNYGGTKFCSGERPRMREI